MGDLTSSILDLAAAGLALVSLVVSLLAHKGSARKVQADLNDLWDQFDHYVKRERVRSARAAKEAKAIEAPEAPEAPADDMEYSKPKDQLRAAFGDGSRFFR